MKQISVAELQYGHVILEGEKLNVTTKVERLDPCSMRGFVHVNRNYCYDKAASVTVES